MGDTTKVIGQQEVGRCPGWRHHPWNSVNGSFAITGSNCIRWSNSAPGTASEFDHRSEEHTSELQSRSDLVCRLLLEKKKKKDKLQDYISKCTSVDQYTTTS